MWLSIGVSSFGDWLALLATISMAQQLTNHRSVAAQGVAISGVLLVRLLPDLLLAPLAGAIADRLDRRKVVIVGECLAGLLYLSIAIIYDLRYLYVAQFVIEGIGLFTVASKQTLWMSTVTKDKLPLGNQVLMFTIYGSFPIAALASALLSTVNRFFTSAPIDPALADVRFAVIVALGLDAISYFASAATIYLNRKRLAPRPEHPSRHTGIFGLIAEGAKFVFGDRVVRSLYIGVIGAFAAGGITVGVAQLYVNTLGAGAAGFNILVGTAFTGLALGMVIGPKVLSSFSRRRIFGASIAGAGLSLIGMAVVGDFVLGLAFSFGVGICAGMAWILGYTMIGEEVEDRLRGRTFSFVQSSARIVLMVTLAVGPVLAGVFGHYAVNLGGVALAISGPGLALLLAGAVALLIGVFAARHVAGSGDIAVRAFLGRFLMRRGNRLIDTATTSGLFVVLEGADLDRTRDYAERIAAQLRVERRPVVLTGEPTESAYGKYVGDVLRRCAAGDWSELDIQPQTAIFLSAADRAEHVAQVIRPALERGDVVICNRYVDTTVAFLSHSVDTDPETIIRLSEWGNEGLRPDVTIVLDEAGGPEPIRRSYLSRVRLSAEGYRVVPIPAAGQESADGEPPPPDPYDAVLDQVRRAMARNFMRIGPLAVLSDLGSPLRDELADDLMDDEPPDDGSADDGSAGDGSADYALIDDARVPDGAGRPGPGGPSASSGEAATEDQAPQPGAEIEEVAQTRQRSE